MPILLDVLTVIFVVGSVALLWMNLRSRRPTQMAPRPKRGLASVHRNKVHLAAMPEADVAASRAAAEQCLDHAGRSTSQTEKEAWLRMGVQWIKVAESAERHSADRTNPRIDLRRYS